MGLEDQETRPRGGDGRLPALAARQHGLITSSQLAALGFAPSAIRARLWAGRLHRVHRGVYAVGHPGLTFEARCLAAVMATGNDGLLSHRAAAALWGLGRPPAEPFDVTTARRTREGSAGIRLHRVRRPPEATKIKGIPVTTVPRTLLDLAATAPASELERAVREAHAVRAVRAGELNAFVDRVANRPGAPALRQALGRSSTTRSALERAFLALCRRAGLEPPEINQIAAGLEVDFVWPDRGIVVETDGAATHATRHGFERDRERDATLARAGMRVLRFCDRQITRRPAEVVETLSAVGVPEESGRPRAPADR